MYIELNLVFESGLEVFEIKKKVLKQELKDLKIGRTKLKPHLENLQINLKYQN